METQLTIARRLGYVSESEVRRLEGSAGEVARMLNGLIKAIKTGNGETNVGSGSPGGVLLMTEDRRLKSDD